MLFPNFIKRIILFEKYNDTTIWINKSKIANTTPIYFVKKVTRAFYCLTRTYLSKIMHDLLFQDFCEASNVSQHVIFKTIVLGHVNKDDSSISYKINIPSSTNQYNL